MIEYVEKCTNNNYKTCRSGYCYSVAYKSGRLVTYNQNKKLPMTVLDFMWLGQCETKYIEHSNGITKIERWTVR